MIAHTRFRLALSLASLALFTACGGPKQSPETRQYLQKVAQATDQLDSDLAKITVPQAPALPAELAAHTEKQAAELERFGEQLKPYYTAANGMANDVLAVCDKALSATRSLDPLNVDPAAVDFAEQIKGLTDRRQQLAVNMIALVAGQRSAMAKGFITGYTVRVMDAGVAALLAPGSGPAPAALEPTPEQKAQMDSQTKSVAQAITAWAENVAQAAKARSDLAAALKAKYPGDDWSFLAAR